jgi:2-amino-4-hydroxy-6-hydroxymethyldihydropteridine diphosphokinase
MAKVYLSTGSNQGDRLMLLVAAAKYISKLVGRVDQFSQVVESEPWGFEAETTFYNQVLVVETALKPREVLEQVLKIEQTLGRKRTGNGYSSRTIDIDILFCDDDQINEPDLVVPHPELPKRRFVLLPLAELAPELVHPVLKITVAQLLERLHDESRITTAVEKDEFARLLNL